MSLKFIVVVHGIANHDESDFRERVAVFESKLRPDLPDIHLIPVYWGDLGGRSVDISDCLPVLSEGQWATRAADFIATNATNVAVRGAGDLNNATRAETMLRAPSPRELVRSESDATISAVAEALGRTANLQRINDPVLLEAIGDIVREALRGDSDSPSADQFAVRTGAERIETRGWIAGKVGGVIAGIDAFVGKLVENRLGLLNQRLRASLMNGVSATLGDIVAYEGNKGEIQGRIWKAIAKCAPGYGVKERPIGLIAHSLGGVIAFDAMVAPASGIPLCVNFFVSFGSQPAFFEIMAPRVPGPAYRSGRPVKLPDTIGRWLNLWDIADPLAFTAGTVFRMSDAGKPEDIPVADPLSTMLDEKLWLHSIYWTSAELRDAMIKAFS